MLGSTDFISVDIWEKIIGRLKDIQSDDVRRQEEIRFTKTCELLSYGNNRLIYQTNISLDVVLLRSCNKLLKRALLVKLTVITFTI